MEFNMSINFLDIFKDFCVGIATIYYGVVFVSPGFTSTALLNSSFYFIFDIILGIIFFVVAVIISYYNKINAC